MSVVCSNFRRTHARSVDDLEASWPDPPAVAPRATRSPRTSGWDDQFVRAVVPELGRLKRLARGILRSDDLADDAVQEALIGLWKLGELPANPAGWLTRAVVHRSLHFNRCRQRRRGYEERASRQRDEPDRRVDPARRLEAEEVAATLESALLQMPEPLRMVLLFRMVEDMDYESIAEALEIPIGTVRSRLNRARTALEEMLRELFRDEIELPARG